MQRKLVKNLGDGLLANIRYRRKWKRITSVLSVFVAVGTLGSLMLPAITLNQNSCGLEEHTHSAECYEENPILVLTCSEDTLGLHKHTADCYDSENNLICNQADFIVHTHDSACLDASGNLVCTIREVREHLHDDSCYEAVEVVIDEGHTHTDDCYQWVTSETPTCNTEESTGHQHTDTCYAVGGELLCTEAEQPAHTHGEECYSMTDTITCGLEESAGHTHGPECLDEEGNVICGQEESGGHQHEAGCITQVSTLVCTTEETAGHQHGTDCVAQAGALLCSIPEHPGHQHSADCYGQVRGSLICEEQEREAVKEMGEPLLICEKPEVILHTHDDACYLDGSLVCPKMEVREHQHTTDCTAPGEAVLICKIEEHTHTEECRDGNALSEEEQAQVDAVIAKINELPSMEEVQTTMTAYEEAGDAEGQSLYYTALSTQVNDTYNQYLALSETQKTAVTNIDTLMEFNWMLLETPAEEETPTNLEQYVERMGGTVSVTLLDKNNNEITDGSEVYLDEDYTMVFHVATGEGEGFLPGTYTYQLPEGIKVEPISAELKDDNGVVYGEYSIDENGLVTFDFNENADGKTNVKVWTSTIVQFTEEDKSIIVDDNVTVTVKPNPDPPEPDVEEPNVRKTGQFDKNDPNKISWSIRVQGGKDFPLAGQTVTDALVGESMTYDEEDRSIWAEVYTGVDNGHGDELYYSWSITTEATWTETGWTYTIPKTIECDGCNDPTYSELVDGKWEHKDGAHNHVITINDNWKAYFFFDSTVADATAAKWENKVTVGDKESTGTVSPSIGAGIVKTGELVDGVFKWTIEATIPGSSSTSYFWYIWDSITVSDTDGYEVPNDLDKATVTTVYNGTTVNVPHLLNATASDRFAFTTWTGSDTDSGEEIDFVHQCECTADTCVKWNADEGCCDTVVWVKKSEDNWVKSADGTPFCRCWTEASDVTFTITYETAASNEILTNYGGLNKKLENDATLQYKTPGTDGSEDKIQFGAWDDAKVPIPGVFNKALIDPASQDNSYIADFQITVNEELRDLSTESESTVTIRDTMSETLIYQRGSMVITRTDAAGTVVQLVEGTDFTLSVSNNMHTVDIVILEPGPYKYTLTYSAMLDSSKATDSGIAYNNSASVTMFGVQYSANIGNQNLSNIQYYAENHEVKLAKTDENGNALAGAEFKLCTETGGVIATGITDENGALLFKTSVSDGITFMMNTPYYLQETKAPDGFILDGSKHWFYFADETNAELEEEYPGIARFPKVQNIYTGTVTVVNKFGTVELPATGGIGTSPYIFSGWAIMLGACALMYKTKRKVRKEAK